MDWLSFAFGFMACLGIVFVYAVGCAAGQAELKRRLQHGEHEVG